MSFGVSLPRREMGQGSSKSSENSLDLDILGWDLHIYPQYRVDFA